MQPTIGCKLMYGNKLMRLLFEIDPDVCKQLPPIALTFSGDTLYIFRKYTQAFGFHKRSKHKSSHKLPQKKPESFGIPFVVPKKLKKRISNSYIQGRSLIEFLYGGRIFTLMKIFNVQKIKIAVFHNNVPYLRCILRIVNGN